MYSDVHEDSEHAFNGAPLASFLRKTAWIPLPALPDAESGVHRKGWDAFDGGRCWI